MKEKVFLAIIVLFFAGNSLSAQPNEKPKNKFITLGFSGNTVGDEFFPGIILGLGYYTSPKSLLSIEFSGGGKNGPQIGKFDYYIEKTNGNRKYYDDGKIYYNYNYYLPMISWSYVGSISEKFKWRVGPSAGLLVVSTGDSFSPTIKNGVFIDGIPRSDREYGIAGMLGANIGVTWNFHRRWFVELAYIVSVNTGIHISEQDFKFSNGTFTVDERDFGKIGNQFNLSAGWRF